MNFKRFLRLFNFSLIILFLSSCHSKRKADLIIYNATIYTVNNSFTVTQAMAVKKGKIVSIGYDDDILDDYESQNMVNLKGKYVYPGFIDAHCHFYGYATDLLKCDVSGTKSYGAVLDSLSSFSKTNKFSWLLARGWDQNDWEVKEYPDKTAIDNMFPNSPVFILRIDGHAALCNQVALDLAGITINTSINGGEILKKDGKLTGLLIDNAIDLVKQKIPPFEPALISDALMNAQENCFAAGLTTVDDAGLGKDSIEFMKSLQDEGKLKLRIYAMLSDAPSTLNYYLNTGPVIGDRMTVRAIKVYADGALGSRGACLKNEYQDSPGHYGFLLHDKNYLENIAAKAKSKGFQMCTHAIGDSAVEMVLKAYMTQVNGENNRRWRIEHCQVVDPKAMRYFGDNSIIPSVQPTHATSDMYWAESRLGPDRMKHAYAYNDLLQQAEGVIALGTDFPVEKINPLYTFYAAVTRKDLEGYPPDGFQKENELSKKNALRGMTIWAAYSNFEEEDKGSIEEGKLADFVVLDKDIMEISDKKIPSVRVLATYINGELVFELPSKKSKD